MQRRFGAPYMMAHRPDLHDALIAKVPANAIHLNKGCASITNTKDGAAATFADVEGDFIPELHWLKVLAGEFLLAGVASILIVGDVVALLLSALSDPAAPPGDDRALVERAPAGS